MQLCWQGCSIRVNASACAAQRLCWQCMLGPCAPHIELLGSRAAGSPPCPLIRLLQVALPQGCGGQPTPPAGPPDCLTHFSLASKYQLLAFPRGAEIMEDSFHLLLDLAQAAQRPDLLRTVSCCIQAACCCAFACKLLRPGSTAGTPCVTPGAPAPFRSPSICASALQIQQRLDEYCRRHEWHPDSNQAHALACIFRSIPADPAAAGRVLQATPQRAGRWRHLRHLQASLPGRVYHETCIHRCAVPIAGGRTCIPHRHALTARCGP